MKPHLFKAFGMWRCASRVGDLWLAEPMGIGYTFDLAYSDWLLRRAGL